MWKIFLGIVLGVGFLALAGRPADADTQTILGIRFDVRNPSDDNSARRRALVLAYEGPDSTDPLVGDPTVDGATLRLVVRGAATVYDATFELPAAGWQATFKKHDWPVYKGFAYSNKTTGGPVRRVIIKRSGFASREGTPPPDEPAPGRFRIKVRLVGKYGPIDVLPPDPGADGGMVLTLGAGDSYCVGFGSVAGGTILSNTARRFAISRPTAEACPGE